MTAQDSPLNNSFAILDSSSTILLRKSYPAIGSSELTVDCIPMKVNAQPVGSTHIRQDSKIEFLHAERTGNWWLHVILHGARGCFDAE